MSAPSGASKGQEEASVASVVVEATQDDTPGKIPAAIFFEDVPAAVEKHGADALIQQLTDLSQKYRLFVGRLQCLGGTFPFRPLLEC